jgi:hypothetical protein
MDSDGMRKVATNHGVGEMTRDWDLVLSTMSEDCVYRFYPYRLQISGIESFIELWSRFFTREGPLPCFDPSKRVSKDGETSECVSSGSLIRMASSTILDPEGVCRGITHLTAFTFRNDLIARETVFFDSTHMLWIDKVFDPDFRSLPGVTEI